MAATTLVLTVGTGNVDEVEASLLSPLRKSMAAGDFRRIVLLPSRVSHDNALALQSEGAFAGMEVAPLPHAGDEMDPDTCFAHFDAVLAGLIADGCPPEAIIADFTRGTKVMSAALVLAATRRDIPTLRYVTGDLRDSRHMVVAGTERIHDGSTLLVTAARRLDAALDLFDAGNFAAVETLLTEPTAAGPMPALPEDLSRSFAAVRALAAFCAAWDRLNYTTAAALDGGLRIADLPARWRDRMPGDDARAWVSGLAADSARAETLQASDHGAMARHVGRLCADLIANARRRVAQAQYEDAALRAYRIVELIGQAALFREGHDSAAMRGADADVAAFVRKMQKNKSHVDQRGTDAEGMPLYTFPRERVARFLKFLKRDLGPMLLDLARHNNLEARNNSLLIHGFLATGPRDAGPLLDNLDALAHLLAYTFPDDAPAWLKAASSLPPVLAERSAP